MICAPAPRLPTRPLLCTLTAVPESRFGWFDASGRAGGGAGRREADRPAAVVGAGAGQFRFPGPRFFPGPRELPVSPFRSHVLPAGGPGRRGTLAFPVPPLFHWCSAARRAATETIRCAAGGEECDVLS
jgi:hypothetical protein